MVPMGHMTRRDSGMEDMRMITKHDGADAPILIGGPCTGKTMWAMLTARFTNAVLVTRDSIRGILAKAEMMGMRDVDFHLPGSATDPSKTNISVCNDIADLVGFEGCRVVIDDFGACNYIESRYKVTVVAVTKCVVG
jgi:hypothetical protein